MADPIDDAFLQEMVDLGRCPCPIDSNLDQHEDLPLRDHRTHPLSQLPAVPQQMLHLPAHSATPKFTQNVADDSFKDELKKLTCPLGLFDAPNDFPMKRDARYLFDATSPVSVIDNAAGPALVKTDHTHLASFPAPQVAAAPPPPAPLDLVLPVSDDHKLLAGIEHGYPAVMSQMAPPAKHYRSAPFHREDLAKTTRKPLRGMKKMPRQNPSKFCHICARTQRRTPLLVCGNISEGACQKTVCEKCFEKYEWDWDAAIAEGARWQCPHCRGACPISARCYIYSRVNSRRREKLAARMNSAGPDSPRSSQHNQAFTLQEPHLSI